MRFRRKTSENQGLDASQSKSEKKAGTRKEKLSSARSSKWSIFKGGRGSNTSNMATQVNKMKTPEQRKEEAEHALSNAKQQMILNVLGNASSRVGSGGATPESAHATRGEEFFLTFLSGGSWLTKISANSKPYRRYFYFDRQRRVIFYEGSKKKSKQRAKYDTRDMIDVRKGYQSDVFNKCEGKYNKTFRRNRKEGCSFSIVFSGKTAPLNLVGDYPEICDLWVRGLKFLVFLNDKLQKQQDEKVWITDYFYAADSSEDGQLEFNEIWALLQRMSVKMTKKEAKMRFQKALSDTLPTKENKGSTTLNLEQFVRFYHDMCRRDEIHELFADVATNPERGYMTLDDVQSFLHSYQDENYDRDSTESLIKKYEPSSANRAMSQLSVHGFQFLLNSQLMNVRNYAHNEIYQDMTQPLSHYFISSSHNTYLIEDQLRGPSSIEGYIRALMAGCRCVELDCWDGDHGPVVYHGYTLTSKILFKDIIEDAIKVYAFHKSKYPLILSLENHCSIDQQRIMAELLTSSLGDMLHRETIDTEAAQLPSPEALKGKILIKCRKLPSGPSDHQGTVAEEDSDDEMNTTVCDDAEVSAQLSKKKKRTKMKLSQELSDLVTYVQSVGFQGFTHVQKQGKPYEMSSFSEKKSMKLMDEDTNGDFVEHTKKQICRIYPAGTRTDSSNYLPVPLWNNGCQLVSLNFQTSDRPMQIYRGKFLDNGACGYVLKPPFLTDKEISSNPDGAQGQRIGFKVEIKFISGSHLPKPEGEQHTSDLVDPYVKLEVFGVRDDCYEFKTSAIPDNGLNPRWNEIFQFHLTIPELAIVRVCVKDYDALSSNDIIGQECIPFTSLKTGYRHLKLSSSEGLSLGPAAIFVHVQVTEMSRNEWVRFRSSVKSKHSNDGAQSSTSNNN